MFDALQVVSVVLVVVALVPALAHALELPGKLRLKKDEYFAVQPIYYPGFTIAGLAEPAAVIATIVLLVLTPPGSGDFWLTLGAVLGLIGMHSVYWLFTHPVNNFWLRDETLSGLGSTFFSFGSEGGSRGGGWRGVPADWTDLRDRWEYSHVARAGLAGLSFVVLVIAVASGGGG